jgi:hypothetical protein
MLAIRFSETSVITRATLRNIPEDGIIPVVISYEAGVMAFALRYSGNARNI